MFNLKQTLWLNSLSSVITGAGLIFFAPTVTKLFGLYNMLPIQIVGVFLVLFAALVFYAALRKETNLQLVKAITTLDILWVISSALLLCFLNALFTVIGILVITGVALWVALMATLQIKGSREFQ